MRRLFAVPLAVVVACAATPPEPAESPRGPSSHEGHSLTSADGAPEADAGAFDASSLTEVSATDGDASAPATGPSSCPENMALVEGDYCTEVEQKCKKSWFDKSNKKTVCEEFEAPSRCVGQKLKKRFCIDKYEWPNVAGVRPEVMNNFYQAQVKCAAMGKRMCTESEWTMSCEGPELKPYPYGYSRDATKCNGDHPWDGPNMTLVARRDPKELARLWRGVPSGSQPECVSDYGVHDLPGNADEVVQNEQTGGDWRGKYSSVHSGGPWYKGVRNQCRPKIYTHDEGFYYYFLSFRCCAEPDGGENDPLTLHQQRARWDMGRVERLARFTVSEMKEKLELKQRGECTCKANDTLCKTMCGTLLGPDAKDADPKAPRD